MLDLVVCSMVLLKYFNIYFDIVTEVQPVSCTEFGGPCPQENL